VEVRKLENQEPIERLYFELASESRLSILQEISKQDGKMREIARKLELTTTETFRQLQRLNDALLVQKKPEGTYAIRSTGY
jgi:predicted transcriptional regulator